MSGTVWCSRCGKLPGTVRWVASGGALAMSHGFYEMWCQVCVLEVRVQHAEKVVASLPALRAELHRLRTTDDLWSSPKASSAVAGSDTKEPTT